MKYPFRSHILPRFTIIAGILGLLLRIWLFAAEDEKGLLPANHFAGVMLYILSAAVLLVLFLSTRKLTPRRVSKQFIRLNTTYSCLLGGLGLALNAAFKLSSSAVRLAGLATIASLAGTVVMVVMAFFCFTRKRLPYIFPAFVSIVMSLETIAQCQVWGAEPQVPVYFFPLLASVFLILTAYCNTLLAARKPTANRLAFFSQAALYFSIVSLNSSQWMLYLCMAFWAASQIYPCTRFKKKV